jgi:hypothetical protein
MTILYKNVKKITLKVEFCVVCLEAALNTETSFTIRTPKHGLLSLAMLVTHYTTLYRP